MKEPDITARWIAAGKALAADPTTKVPCPVCGEADLTVKDIPIQGSNKFERVMECPNCHARNVLLMTAPQ
ncbi:MAG TPA: hypothetical protein VM689_20680 [Aliidongia sp.]|nr:hypothetical protein [Aliidongia sp.]